MDILPLAQHLLREAVFALEKPVQGFAEETLQVMMRYPWPGNVRELRNEIVRMLALSVRPYLDAELMSQRVLNANPQESPLIPKPDAAGGGLKERMEALEKRVLSETLIRHRWNKSRAAQELGLSRVGLRAKLLRYGLGKA